MNTNSIITKVTDKGMWKSYGNRLFNWLQKFAKSLIIPICILPFAALINRLGNLLMAPNAIPLNSVDGWAWMWWIGFIMATPGAVIFTWLPLFFAISIGFGMSDDYRGEAALSASVGWVGMTAINGDGGLPLLLYSGALIYTPGDVMNMFSNLNMSDPSQIAVMYAWMHALAGVNVFIHGSPIGEWVNNPAITNIEITITAVPAAPDGSFTNIIEGYEGTITWEGPGANSIKIEEMLAAVSFTDSEASVYAEIDGGLTRLLYFPGGMDTIFSGTSPITFNGIDTTIEARPVQLYSATGAYMFDTNVFGGIIAGLVVAWLYNNYREIAIPQSLAFFGGRRFIPMLAMTSVWVVGFIFAVVWPWGQYVLISIGQWVGASEGWHADFGFLVYGIFNRLCQPLGLHHIINTFLWFQLPVVGHNLEQSKEATRVLLEADPTLSAYDSTHGLEFNNLLALEPIFIISGDIPAFQAGIIGAGTFQAGYFPLFIGGLPGAAAAMYYAAPKDQRKEVMTYMGGVAFVSFLTGIDEPLVFAFIFVSPVLYLMNCFFTAAFGTVVTAMGIKLGFGFSAGLIDYTISFWLSWQVAAYAQVPWLANPLWIFPIAFVMFWVYLVSFYMVIIKMNVPTPGRDSGAENEEAAARIASFRGEEETIPDEGVEPVVVKAKKSKKGAKPSKEEKYDSMAQAVFDQIYMHDNLINFDNCTSRFRLIVKDNHEAHIDDKALKAAGFFTILRMGKGSLHLIVGTDVENVSNRVRDLIKDYESSHKSKMLPAK